MQFLSLCLEAGGPQAIHETKTTNSYWRQVSKYLELEMAKIQKESFLFDATPIEKKHCTVDNLDFVIANVLD